MPRAINWPPDSGRRGGGEDAALDHQADRRGRVGKCKQLEQFVGNPLPRQGHQIVRAVLSLADALGMSNTAEGIEKVELATLGCDSGQGYYFAKPLQADAALEYWKSRRKA